MIPILDHSEERRVNEDLLAIAVADPRSCFILLNGDQALLDRGCVAPVVLTGKQLQERNLSPQSSVLLGFHGDVAWLAFDIQDISSSDQGEVDEFASFADQGHFVRLSSIDQPVAPEVWNLLSQARALLAWNRGTAHCPLCGGATVSQSGGYHRVCLNVACGKTHFPRTDPAVIVRVLHKDRCLLARQPRFRPGLRSVIAGFVEPGESFEETVHREVLEEVGLEVNGIVYLGSQPWPFPMSIMIAFEAHALSDAITIDGNELESAAWYSREHALAEIANGQLLLPTPKSIARRMIDEWLNKKETL